MAHYKIRDYDFLREQCIEQLGKISLILAGGRQSANDATVQAVLSSDFEDWKTSLQTWEKGPRTRLFRNDNEAATSACEAQLKAMFSQLKALHKAFFALTRNQSDSLPPSELCDAISRNIVELNTIDATLAQDQTNRKNRRTLLHQKVFDQALTQIKDMPETKRKDCFAHTRSESAAKFRDGDMQWFWRFIPKITDAKFRYQEEFVEDGYLVPEEEIIDTQTKLTAIATAWVLATLRRHDIAKLDTFLGMPKIAIILNNISNGQQYFDNFVDRYVNDEMLCFTANELQTFINGNDVRQELRQQCAKQFFQVQYRLSPHKWKDRDDRNSARIDSTMFDHIECEPDEPLALKRETSYDTRGTFSEVYKVTCLVTHQEYAHKKLRLDADPQHIQHEIEVLKRVKHHHILELKRSYRRGREVGFLAHPAGECNLSEKLHNFADKEHLRKDMYPHLLRAFGCLSMGIRYLHRKGVRHRDVKPENLLWHKNSMVIADFGLASMFTEEEGSRMHDANVGTRGFVPPEAQPTNPNLNASGHGRATDVFALGCTFLEMLSALIFHVHSAREPISFRSIGDYSTNSPKVGKWIDTALQSALGREYPYKALLELAGSMVDVDDVMRPKIGRVVSKIYEIQHNAPSQTRHRHVSPVTMFCNKCEEQFEREKIQEEPESNSRPASHHSKSASQHSKSSSLKKLGGGFRNAFRSIARR